MSQSSSVEVLVHIAAPSGPKDDAQYRAHAEAGMGFESVTKFRIHPELNDAEDHSRRVGDRDGHNIRKSEHYEGLRGTFDELDMSYSPTKLQVDSSGKEVRETQTQPDSPSGGQDDGSAADDSVQYLPIETARHQASSGDRTVATQFRRDRLQVINPGSSFQTPPSTVPETPQPGVHDETLTASYTPTPTLTPTPTPTSTWDVERNNSPDNGPIAFQPPSSSFPCTNETSSPAKRRRLDSSAENLASASFSSCNPSFASVVGISTPQSPTAAIPSSQLSQAPESPIPASLPDLPLEIMAPPPLASSTANFKTHITPSLRMLLGHPKLSRLYRPIYEARPIGKGERGYWSLHITITDGPTAPNPTQPNNTGNFSSSIGDMPSSGLSRADRTGIENNTQSTAPPNYSPWTPGSFMSFWDYLARYITQEGKAGWGVWCVCENSSPSSSTAGSGNAQPRNSAAMLDVRIYTWGEIISHTYLLILLASDRRIRKLQNVEWRDGSGETVVRMT